MAVGFDKASLPAVLDGYAGNISVNIARVAVIFKGDLQSVGHDRKLPKL